MKIKQWFALFTVLCSVLLLAACGSNSGSGGDQTAAPAADDLGSDITTGIAYVGTEACIGCHEDFSWSAELATEFLEGTHVIHSTHITQADAADGCLDCHDPIGDGPNLEALIDAANVPAEGLAAVGCEACHGAGGDHYGIGPMPVPKPDYTACASCHSELPDSHLAYHPEANNIDTKFVASRHFTASVRNEAICSKCHTDAGGKLYKDVTTRDQLLAIVLPVLSDAAVQCRTCHNPHNAGGLLFDDVEDRGAVVASGEYATCVSCHMGDNAAVADDGAGGTDWDVTEAIYHEDVYYRIITDTHYDDPATTDTIEGYVIDPVSDRACRDCHDVHAVEEIRADDDSSSFSNTINDQWAKSGHAGQIGTVKLAVAEHYGDNLGLNRTTEQTVAIKAAGVTSVEGDAWVHYDWDAANRQSCQECHTSTGAKNYLNDPAGYDDSANDFSHLADWAVDADGVVTSSGQNELLYCWGCHSDNNGGLRNPGAISRPYTVDAATVTLPDVGNSNVCINCHGARGNMDSYEIGVTENSLTGNPATDMSTLAPGFGGTNVTEAHYLVASATLYQAQTRIGYEYPVVVVDGDSNPVDAYADVSYFAHNAIGLNGDAPETGSGPCAACHMETDEGHTFNVVDKDDAGAVTALKSTSCVACHSGAYGTALVSEDTTIDGVLHTAAAAAAFLEEEAEGFHGALALLEAELLTDGLTFAASYPYFSGASWTNEGNFGAAHNYNYLHHEPGAYAHNRIYAKRLIFDSIDWLQNGALTGTIDVSAATADGAAWLGTSRP
jgi:hypothetical protein